ncbi:MAG: alanine racemase [Chloroflexi bacterium]|nr:alanine racemase [Chloroflexota bacterium]
MSNLEPRVWVEVDLSAIANNVAAFRKIVGAKVRLMPLIKGDAYGCGAPTVGKAAIANGADWLGVELVEEALPLREAGLQAPILVSGPACPQDAGAIAANRLRVTVRDLETVDTLEAEAQSWRREIRVHVELDTGLNRLGLCEEEALALIRRLQECQFVKLEGVWTHFAESDEDDPDFTEQQFQKYLSFLRRLGEQGIPVPIRHVANSAALLKFPRMHLDMVRFGESVYGYLPKKSLGEMAALQPVITWKSRVIQTRTIRPGESIGYGRTWTARRTSLVGTIPVGYADGYRRCFSNRSSVLVRGKRAPLAGRVSMHMIVVDLTDIPGATIGDEVVLLGKQKEAEISAYDLAGWADTAEFEILVGISPQVERLYV